MNKIFKVIWSKSKQCYIVVSEIAKNKTGKKKIVVASILATLALTSNVVTVHGAMPDGSRTDILGVAIGTGSASNSNQSVAIGYASSAQAPSSNPENPATAVGAGANANGAGAVALGLSANAKGTNAVALGGGSNGGTNKTEATADYATAIGFNAKATGSNSIAIGKSASITKPDVGTLGGQDSIAMGTGASAKQHSSISVGLGAASDGVRSVAIGPKASATDEDSIAIGTGGVGADKNNQAVGANGGGATLTLNGISGVQLYYGAKSTGKQSIAMGYTANAKDSGIAIGNYAVSDSGGGTAIGKSVISRNGGVVVGQSSNAIGKNSIAYGNTVKANGETSTAMGYSVTADGQNAVAVGYSNTASAKNSVSIGSTNQAKNEGSIAVGRGNNATNTNTVVIGRDSNASGNQSVAMGASANSKGTNDTAIGNDVTADGDNSVAIGRSATTKSSSSLAIGTYGTKGTSATGAYSIAMGRDVTASAESAIAIGKDAVADKKNAVAFGSGSDTSSSATAQSSTTIGSKTYSWNKGVLSGADLAGMQVSVGAAGKERQIKNVAAGEISANSTDAINGAQLYSVASGLAKDLKTPYVSIKSGVTGTGSNVDNDGATGANSIAIGPSSAATNQDGVAFGNNAQSLSAYSIAIGTNAKAESGSGITNASRAIAIGSNSRVATNVTQGIAIGSGSLTDEGAVVTGDQSIAIGGNVKVDGHAAIAIGGDDARKAAGQQVSYTSTNDVEVTGTLQTAIQNLTGYNLSNYKGTAASHAGVAYGTSALAGNAGVAIGTASDSMTRMNDKGQVVNNKPVTNAVAIGTGARANFDNSVAIGGGSNTDHYATKQVNAIIDGVEVKWAGGDNISPGDVVSFGAKGFERQLKNVAPGEVSQTSTDAINGSQIYSLARKVTNIMNGGAGSLVNVNASGEPLTKVVTGTGANKQEKYYRTVDVKDDGSLQPGAVAQTPKSLALVNVDEPNVNQQTQTPRTLGNVANGVKDNDAVNVSQLKAATVKYFSVNSTDAGNRDNTGATGTNAIAIGPTAKSTGDNALAIGNNAQANSPYAVALGHYANNGSTNSANSVSIGFVAGGGSNGAGNVAIGSNAGKQVTGNNNISLGNTAGTVLNNNVYTSESILLGTNARVTGSTSSKSVNSVIAIGKGAEGSATSATALGINANASAENAMALGPSSKATAYNGVALGSFSEANTAGGTAGYNVNTSRTDKYAGLTGLALTANTGAVSIGNATTTRQITNLAAGTNDTDAVNVAQLKSVNLAVKGNSGAGGDVNLATNPLTIKGNDNYITTSASGNTVNISGKVQNISVSNGTATAAVGMADAKNVAEAINNAVSQNAYTWNLTADNDTAGSRSTITKEGTVKFSGDQNITVKRDGNTISSSLNKSITVDSVKANNSVTTGSGSNQITLDGTTGAVTGKTFSGQSFTAGNNVLSNTTLQIGSPTNGDNNVTITKDGLTSKAGTKTAKFGANGIDAGGQQIANVSSGGNVGTNAANITDVKNAVSDVTLKLDTNSKAGTVKLSESPLKVIGANGIRTDLVGTNNGSLVVGLDQATVNATTKGIGLTGDTGSTGNKYLKDGDVSFAVTGDGNLVSTSATTAGVKVAVNAAKVKDLAVEAVTVSKDTQADNPITVTPTAGTNSKDYAIGIDTTKLAGKTDLTYRANNDTDANAQKVSLAKGLNFVNGDNTVATVAADGKVSYDLNAAIKTKIDNSATAVARNISLGADSGTASSQSLKDGNVAFNVKGATGDYVSTNMNGNTVEISTTRATINSDTNTGAASVTGNDGLATAKNVADAINKAADAAKAGAAWNLTTNSSATDKTSVQGGDTVDLINGDNIVITQDGTDKKKITVATKKDLTVDSVTAGNTVINTSGLTNGTTAITGSGITTDKVTVGGISIDKTDGINAGGKAISNVASGGTTDTNAANIGDVKQAVANLSQNLNITDGTNNGTVDLKNQKLNVAGANGVTATVNNQTITVGLDADTVNATTKGIGLTADTGSTGNKYLKDGDVSFAVTGDGNLVSTSATAAGVKVAVDAAKVKDLAVDAVTVSKDTQADNPITVTPTAGTNSKDYAIGIDTTKLAAKTDLTYRANNDTDANAKKVSLAKGLNFVNGTLTTASIDTDGVVKYDVNTASITAGADGTVTGPTTDGVATAQNVADAINAAKKASKTEITANTGEAANATTGNVTLTSTTAADGHTIYDVKLNDTVTLGTGANAVTIDGATGKVTAKNAVIGGVTVDGDNSHVTGLSNTTWNGTATTGRAATEDQLKAVADTAKATTDAVNLKFSGDTNTSAGVVNLKDDTFNIVGDGKYVTTDANGKDLTVKVSEAEVKKSAVAAVTVSTDTTDANNPISVTPTTSADGTTKDYKVTIDGTKIANKTNLSYKANDGTAKQVSLADGLNFKNGTLTTASIDDAGVVKYDVNTATITAGTDGTVTGPTTDGVATAQNVADAINAAKKAAKTEITANTGEAANATTGNVTLTSTTATDGHTIYDVKLNDTVTLGTGSNAVTIDGTAGKVTAGSAVVDGVNNTITTGGANTITLDGAAGTVTGLTNKDWTPGVTKAVTGRAATEDQLQKVADAASSQTWNITADKAGTTGAQTGTKKNATVGKDQTVELVAGDNLTINQDERKFTYSLNKDLAGLTSVSVGDGTTETINLDGATGKITAKNAVIGGVTVDGDNSHVTGLSNTTWNGTATTGRAATEDQLKAVADTAKATTDAVNLKFSGDTNTSAGVVNLKDDTFNIVGDGKYVTTDANGKDLTVKVSEAEVKKSAVAAVTVSTDTTDANNPISVTPTTSADGTTKDYKVTIDGTKIANKTNLSYKANDGTAKQVSLADGLNFKNGTLTTASIDDAGVVKYDVNTAAITAGTDGTVTGPTTDGVATAQNVADAINAAKKAAKTEITANTGEAANATTGNVTLTSTTAADGHTIYDVKLNDKVTLGTGANAVTIDGTAGKATVGTAVVDGVNNTITTGGANAVALDGAAGTVKTGTVTVTGGTTNDITGLSNTTVTAADFATKGRAATEEQLKAVGEQTWKITADKDATTSGAQTGTKKDAKVGKDDKVQLIAGENLTVNQNERDFTYSLNKDLVKMNSATFEATGGKTTVITGDSIAQTDGTKTNTSTAAGNTVADGGKSTATTADGTTVTNGADSTATTAAGTTVTSANGNTNYAADGVRINTTGKNPVSLTDAGLDNGNNVIKNVASGHVNNDDTDNTNAANIADVKKATTTVTANNGEAANATTGNVTLTSTTAADGHTIYDVKLNDKVTLGTGANAVTIDGTAGKATIGSSVVDGVNNTITTGGANAVALDGAAGTVKTGTVTVSGGTTNDITGLSNTTVNAADFATKGRAATEEQLKQVGEQTWQITADKDATTSGNQTGTKKDAKVGKDDKVQLIAGENLTVNQNERDFTYSLNKDLVKMNSATFEATGGKTTVITGDSIAQTDGTKTNTSTAAGNTVADGTKSTETTAAGQVIKDGAKTNTSTVDENTLVDGAKSNKTTVDSNVIDDGNGNINTSNATSNTITDGTNTSTITAGKATIGSSVVDGVNNTITTGGANAVALDGVAGTVKTGTVTVTGGTTNDITGLSNTTVNSADFATKGRAATEEQLKAVGEQTWQITADKDATTSGNQTGTKKDAKVGKDDKVQLIAGENLTVNQNERDFTYSLNKDLVKMNSATFEATGGKTTVITGDSIAQTDGTKTNTSTAAGNTVADGGKSTATTADGTTVTNGADSTATTAAGTTVTNANGNTNYAADGVRINTTGKNPVSLTDAGLDNGNNVIKNVASGHVNNDDTDNTNAANIADVKKATTTVTANNGEAANATTGNVTLTSTTATDGHTIYDVKLNDTVTLGTGSNAVTIDGTAGKATIGSSVVDGVNNTITTGGANAVALDGVAGTVKTGTVTVTGGTTNDITGLSNTTVNSADFATKGRAATEEQLKAVGEQTWQITADKDATTSGNQTGTKKDAKVGKDDKVQLIAGENLTVNQNERDFTYSLNKDLVKMNSATFEATGGKTTVITGDSIAQTDGTKTNTSTAAGNTVADGGKSTATTADGTTVTNGADSTATTAAGTTVTNANGNTNYAADGVRINTTGKNPVSLTDAGLDNGNNVIKNVASGHVNNDDTDNTNAANIADVKKATTTVTANNGEAANATTGNVTLTSTTAADGHTIYDVKLNDKVTLGTGNNAVTIDGTAGKATVGTAVVDGVNNTITTGGANAVTMDGAAGTVKTGTVTVTGGTTNDITGLSNTTVNSADFATKGRAATEEQLKQVGEQTWQITADKDATTSGNQTGTKKDAKVGKDDKVQLIAGENLTVNQNERDFTYSLNKDLVKMNSATFEATGGKTTVITGDSIAQTDGTKTNRSTAAGNTVADGTKSTETTAAGQVIKDGAKTNTSTVDENTLVDGAKSNKTTVDSNVIDDGNGNVNTSKATSNTITDGTNTTEATASTVTVKDNAGNSTVITKDTITTGTGANKVTVDGTAGKVTAGSAVIDGVNNTITTGGANTVKLDGAAGTVTGLTNTAWTPGVTKAVSGRAATEDQLQQVSDAVGAGWNVNSGTVAGSTGEANGSAKTKVSSGEEVQLQAGNNLIIDQNGKTLAYSLNKNLKDMESAIFNATGGKTTVIKGDSIVQTDGGKTNTSNAAGNTVVDGAKSTATTAVGTTITDGAKTNTSTADKNVIDDGAGNTNTSNATSNTIADPNGNTNTATATTNTLADNAGNTNVSNATSNSLADNAGNANVSNATSNSLTDNAGNSNVSSATSNTLKNAAGDETKVDAKGATVKDAAGNTTNVASTGATVTNAAGDTTKVEATGTTVADAAGNKATFTKDGVTITKPGKDTVSLTGNGLDNGNNKIVNVADGTNDTDAVNVRQLDAKTKAATTELTANSGESANNTTGNIVLTKTTAPDGHIIYDNKLNDKITLGAADPTKAITVDGTNGTIKAGKDGNAVAINGTDGTIKAGDGASAVTIDGVNGSVKVADKIALNGKDGKAAIGTVGIDGKDGIITTGGNNPVAVNGKDGVVTGLTNKTWDPNNITSGRAATEDQVQSAVANAGWDATVGTEGSGVNSTPSATPEKIRPNETLTFKAGNNMMVSHAGKTISYAVNPELTDMKSATFKDAAGNTTVTNGNGMTITPGSANPNNPNAGPVSLTKDGLNNGNNQIKGVAPGSDDTDAVNIGQLKASNAKMGDAIGQVAGEVQRVGAHAAAMAALKPIQYDPLEPTQVMAGVGNYRGETAAALGLAHYTNENTMFNVGVSVGGNHNMVNAGVTHKFGYSPEKKNIPDRYKAGPISSVYVMQDEVSSLKKENAEQKYVIADQAARLNTLEAENERQRQELAETKQGLDDLRAAVDKLLASKG